jgi:RHS repeat-associated protein
VSTTYQYNGDGLRTSETSGSSTRTFTWDTTIGVPRILFDSTNYYIYGPDGTPIEQITPSETDYFVTDLVGSTRMLLAADGSVGATFSSTPSGDQSHSTGSLRTPLMYAGAYADPASGLEYMVNRSYDPTSGQFTTVDPLVDSSGSAYGYGADDPVNDSDPSGLIDWHDDLKHVAEITAVVAGVAVLAAAAAPILLGAGTIATGVLAASWVLGGLAVAADTGLTMYDCNSTNMDNSRHCLGDGINTAEDGFLAATGVAQEGTKVLGHFVDASAVVKTVVNVADDLLGIDGETASGGTAAPSISTSVVCISLQAVQQSTSHATEYLQPAAHVSTYQSTATVSHFQPAAPVQQSSNIGSLLQGGSSFGGHIYF